MNSEEPIEVLRDRVHDMVFYGTEPEPEEYDEVIADLLSILTREQLKNVAEWYSEDFERDEE